MSKSINNEQEYWMQISFISDQKKEILPVSKARYTQKEHKKHQQQKNQKTKQNKTNKQFWSAFDSHITIQRVCNAMKTEMMRSTNRQDILKNHKTSHQHSKLQTCIRNQITEL